MTVKIPGGFFIDILFECSIKIYSGLVGQADHYKQHISQFISQFLLFARG